MKSYLEALMLGEMCSNEHDNIHKSFQESIQTRQEKRQQNFQKLLQHTITNCAKKLFICNQVASIDKNLLTL